MLLNVESAIADFLQTFACPGTICVGLLDPLDEEGPTSGPAIYEAHGAREIVHPSNLIIRATEQRRTGLERIHNAVVPVEVDLVTHADDRALEVAQAPTTLAALHAARAHVIRCALNPREMQPHVLPQINTLATGFLLNSYGNDPNVAPAEDARDGTHHATRFAYLFDLTWTNS